MLNTTSYSLRSPEIRSPGLAYGYDPIVPVDTRTVLRGTALDALHSGYSVSRHDFKARVNTTSFFMERLSRLIDPATPFQEYGAIAYALADHLQCRQELLAVLAEPADPMHLEAMDKFASGEAPVDVVLAFDAYGSTFQLTPAIVLGLLARAPDDHTKTHLRQPVHDALVLHRKQLNERCSFLSSMKLIDQTRCKRDGQAFEKASRHCIADLPLVSLEEFIARFPPHDARRAPVISPTAAARLLERGALRYIQLLQAAPRIDAITRRRDLDHREGAMGALYWLDVTVQKLRHFVDCVRCGPQPREEAQHVETLRAQCVQAIETYARERLRQMREAGGRKYLASMSPDDCAVYPAISAYLIDQEGAGAGRRERLANRFLNA